MKKLLKLLTVFGLFAAPLAQAQSPTAPLQMQGEITSQLPTNNTGKIDAKTLRGVLNDMVGKFAPWGIDKTVNPWKLCVWSTPGFCSTMGKIDPNTGITTPLMPDGWPPVSSSQLGAVNGVATLDGNGFVPTSQLGNITGSLSFVGTWNAATNTPPLASGVGTLGQYYIVNVAGTTTLDGVSTWNVGDELVFATTGGTNKWNRMPLAAALPGGSVGQLQINAGGNVFGGVTPGGDLSFNSGTGAFTINNGVVSSGKLAAGVAVANLGFTPVNKAGDTMTGTLNGPKVALSGNGTMPLQVTQSASSPSDVATTDSILGSTHSNGTWGNVNMNIKADTTVYGAPDTYVWGTGSVFHYVGTGGYGLHNSFYSQANRDTGRANATSTVAVGGGGASATTVQVANATPFLNINGGTIGTNGLTALVQFGTNGTLSGAGNRYVLTGVNTTTNVLTFSTAVAASDIVLGNPVTARINPELQAGTFELRDKVDLPTTQKSSNTTMEIDLAGNNVDDAGSNQMQVFSCFKHNAGGTNFECTNGSAYYTFPGATIKNAIMLNVQYQQTLLDGRLSTPTSSAARAIWLRDDSKIAFNTAGNLFQTFNSGNSRIETYLNSAVIYSIDALTGKTRAAQAFIQDASSATAEASRGFRQNIDGVEKFAMGWASGGGGVVNTYVNGSGTPAQILDGSGNVTFQGNINGTWAGQVISQTYIAALTGDVTKPSGSGATTLATAQPAVHTWSLTQTFTVAPVFTDQSGSRAALGLGTAATQNTGTSGAVVPLLNGTNTFSGANSHSGIETFNSTNGSWSSFNIGKQLIVTTTGAATNPAIGLFDANNANGIAFRSDSSAGFVMLSMPAVTDSTTAAGVMMEVSRAGLILGGSTTMIGSTVSLSNGAAAAGGTLTNAPVAGNPTKWIPINDNGTTRYIPAW